MCKSWWWWVTATKHTLTQFPECMYIQEIAESLQKVKHKGGSCPPIRTLGMGDITGDCGIFAMCNPFQGFWLMNVTTLIWFAIRFHVAKIPQSPVRLYVFPNCLGSVSIAGHVHTVQEPLEATWAAQCCSSHQGYRSWQKVVGELVYRVASWITITACTEDVLGEAVSSVHQVYPAHTRLPSMLCVLLVRISETEALSAMVTNP